MITVFNVVSTVFLHISTIDEDEAEDYLSILVANGVDGRIEKETRTPLDHTKK